MQLDPCWVQCSASGPAAAAPHGVLRCTSDASEKLEVSSSTYEHNRLISGRLTSVVFILVKGSLPSLCLTFSASISAAEKSNSGDLWIPWPFESSSYLLSGVDNALFAPSANHLGVEKSASSHRLMH